MNSRIGVLDIAHTFVKNVNGYKINHWSLGGVSYINDEGNWIYKHEDLNKVEEFANNLQEKMPWFK